MRLIMMGVMAIMLGACTAPLSQNSATKLVDNNCAVELVVLGIAQDAGAPQLGHDEDRAWQDPSLARLAASLGLVDHRSHKRFLFEATPDIRLQLHHLNEIAPPKGGQLGVDGIFLTHAHIGHYTGLMFLGHESVGASGVPVYAMPRMGEYLSANGPWDQLVRFNNIALQSLIAQTPSPIGDGLSVTPYLVPHRDEYSETVGFVIASAEKSALFLPDINGWDLWESQHGIRIEEMIQKVDFAFVDATFYDNNEIPGRDMSGFPHPRIAASMQRFSALPVIEQKKVRFIHLNHTNPARFADSQAREKIRTNGFKVAQENERYCLQSKT